MSRLQTIRADRELGITDKGAARKRQILKQAKNILVEDGFNGLTFRNIAVRSGVKVGHVSYYFQTKEELMEALAEYIFSRWNAVFQRRVPPDIRDDVELFRYSISYMIEENKRPRTNALLQEMWAMATRSDVVMRMLDVFYAKMRQSIEDMLARVNPALPPRARGHRAALISAQIEGLMVFLGPRRIPREELRGLEEAALESICALAFSAPSDHPSA